MCSCLKCKSLSTSNPPTPHQHFGRNMLKPVCKYGSVLVHGEGAELPACSSKHQKPFWTSCDLLISHKSQTSETLLFAQLVIKIFIVHKRPLRLWRVTFSVFLLVYKLLYQELLHYSQGWQTHYVFIGAGMGTEDKLGITHFETSFGFAVKSTAL